MLNLYQWPAMGVRLPNTVSMLPLVVRYCSRRDQVVAPLGMNRNDSKAIPGLPFRPLVFEFWMPNWTLLALVWPLALTINDRNSVAPLVEKSQLPPL